MDYEEMINDELDYILRTLDDNSALDCFKIEINEDIYYNKEARESFEFGLDNDNQFKDYVYLNAGCGSYTFYKKAELESKKLLPLEITREVKDKIAILEDEAYRKGRSLREMRVGRSIYSCLNVFEYFKNVIKEKKDTCRRLNRYNITMEYSKLYDKALYYKFSYQVWKVNA